MTETLLNYINNILDFPIKIKNIEKEFNNGFLFGELLIKSGNFKGKLSKYNNNPKNNFEIKDNFLTLKKDLKLLGIYINESTINEIMEEKKGVAAKLIYKIKTEIDRIKINFNNIIGKINENSYREKYELGKDIDVDIDSDFNKTSRFELTQTNKFSMSHTMTTRETLSTFTNFFFRPKDKHNNILMSENKLNPYKNLKNKFILKPLISIAKNKEKEKFINHITNSGHVSFKKIDKLQKENEFNIKQLYNENEKNIYNNLLFIKNNHIKKTRKNKSLSLYNNNNTFNSRNIKLYDNSNKYIKYSVFDNNIKKLNINMNEIAPKLKKSGINYNNDYYLDPNQILHTFKDIISSRKEDNKFKIRRKNLTEENHNKLNSKKNIRNFIINPNYEDKIFSFKLKRHTPQYKMHEYNKLIELTNKFNNKKVNYFEQSDNYDYKEIRPIYTDADEFINITENEDYNQKLLDNKAKERNHLKNMNNIKVITHLIIDIVEKCYKSQKKLKQELIDLPEYREWTKFFIEGKSCKRIPILKKKDKNNSSFIEKENDVLSSTKLIKFTKKEENKFEKSNIIINSDELILMEYNDYMFYRGNWDINNFVEKNIFGKQLHIYKVLGNNIFKIIPNVNNLFKGTKPSILLAKTNNEFELDESEINNILIPKSNIRNALFGEIILLNFDGISNEIINNKNNKIISLNKILLRINSNNNLICNSEMNNRINEEKNKDNNKIILSEKINDIDFSYIPIKICLIGHCFSGRKTQAKLLCEKYKNLKSYSINEITQFYIDEYKRFHMPLDKKQKLKPQKKNSKPNQNKEHKDEDDLEQYKDIFLLIEKYLNINKNMENDLNDINIDEISDELKIHLLVFEIKKDFPKKEEEEIINDILIRNEKKEKLEEELKKLRDEMNAENSVDSKENKKQKNKQKKNSNTHNIESITEELEKIIIESIQGFILYDYPNNYFQYQKLENMLTGFVQDIEQPPDNRDMYLNILTNSIDKPYINISNKTKEGINYFNINNNSKKSFFNCYILLELSEKETLKRMNNRLMDPNTGIIYHKEYSPPNQSDKKLNERLIEITEPSDDKIEELISHFYSEFPNILYFIYLFNNFYRIDLENKDEIFKKIEEIIIDEIKKFEERENKDIMGDLIDSNDKMEENEITKYFKRLNESKKIVSKEYSEYITKKWFEQQDKYIWGIKNFIKNYIDLKNSILEQMNNYQDEFIEFLNNTTYKYKLVDIFYKKYNSLLEKYPYLKDHHLIKDEFEKNVSEIIDNLWKMIQMKKIDSISELNNIKNQNFIEQQIDLFGSYIINLFILETNQYYNKINIIKRFYYEFDNQKISEKFPYKYIFEQDKILENIDEYPIFDINCFNSNKIIISPKIDKLYNNCHKLFFYYEKDMQIIYEKAKENIDLTNALFLPKKKIKTFYKKKTKADLKSVLSSYIENRVIDFEEEMKTALSNEKVRYKFRILFLKNFSEKIMKEIYKIGQITFNNLDQQIVESVNMQNNAMNELILKIKNNIKEGVYKLNVKDVELDYFNIYEKCYPNFTEFKLNYLYNLPEQDKKINYNDLYRIFLEVKTYEIQNNYVSLDSVIDIVFKKHLFEYKSQAFMKYMIKIPSNYINIFLNRFIISKSKGYFVIKLNEFFTSLALLNMIPPNNEQQTNMMKSINDKLKYKNYLSKEDFMNCKMWFEKDDENDSNNSKKEKNKENNNVIHNDKASSFIMKRLMQFSKDINTKDKKYTKRGSAIFGPSNLLNKEVSDIQNLKEFLFNVNKNNEELIDFKDFMKRIVIKKHLFKRKNSEFNENKNNIDKVDLASQNSFFESGDKTQNSESTTNYFKASKTLMANNTINNLNINKKEDYKIKNQKSQKLNDSIKLFSESQINNNDSVSNTQYTYFDYLIKKS